MCQRGDKLCVHFQQRSSLNKCAEAEDDVAEGAGLSLAPSGMWSLCEGCGPTVRHSSLLFVTDVFHPLSLSFQLREVYNLRQGFCF